MCKHLCQRKPTSTKHYENPCEINIFKKRTDQKINKNRTQKIIRTYFKNTNEKTPEIDKKSIKKSIKKRIRKRTPKKSVFGRVSASQNHPEIRPEAEKNDTEKRTKTKSSVNW